MYKRISIYLVVIASFLWLIQYPITKQLYNEYSSEIGIVTHILILFLGTYFVLRYKYKKRLIEPISRTPVEFNSAEGYSVIEMGWLYNALNIKIIAAGIIEMWGMGYVYLIRENGKIQVILNRIPTQKTQCLLLYLLFDTEELYVGMKTSQQSITKSRAQFLLRFNQERDLFLKNSFLKKDHEFNQRKKKTQSRVLLFMIVISFIALQIHLLFGAFLILLFTIGYKQIHNILYKGDLTPKGSLVFDKLISYREYLIKMNKKRFIHDDILTLNPQTYNNLPYVILFGIEKEWAKYFSYLWTPTR